MTDKQPNYVIRHISDPVIRRVAESNIRVWRRVEHRAFFEGKYDIAIKAQQMIRELETALASSKETISNG